MDCQHEKSCELASKRGTAPPSWKMCKSCPMKKVSEKPRRPVDDNTPNFLKKVVKK